MEDEYNNIWRTAAIPQTVVLAFRGALLRTFPCNKVVRQSGVRSGHHSAAATKPLYKPLFGERRSRRDCHDDVNTLTQKEHGRLEDNPASGLVL